MGRMPTGSEQPSGTEGSSPICLSFLGIDPGINGGIALIQTSGDDIIAVNSRSCPVTDAECAEVVTALAFTTPLVMIERVHSMPRDGVKSAFTFGGNDGMWRGIMAALHIPYQRVEPKRWQAAVASAMGMGPIPKEKKERKHYFKAGAERFGLHKVTLKTADAIMIAAYGLTTVMGESFLHKYR